MTMGVAEYSEFCVRGSRTVVVYVDEAVRVPGAIVVVTVVVIVMMIVAGVEQDVQVVANRQVQRAQPVPWHRRQHADDGGEGDGEKALSRAGHECWACCAIV